MVTFLVVVALLSGHERPEAVDCAAVRAKVAEHGKVKSYAWALANGYSPKEISRIRKLCGV